MAKRVTRWSVRLHKLRTWIVTTLLCGLGFAFGDGFGALAVGFLLWLYLSKRDAELLELKWQAYDGEVGRVRVAAERAVENGKRVLLDGLINDTCCYGLGTEWVFLCRTCQQSYRKDTIPDLCWNLRDEFPHDPKADPPSPNPFRWYWLAVNGYRLPPDDHADTEPWLPMTATDDDPAKAMGEEGREYFRTHRNLLWDAGFGNQPEWYSGHHD